ncbi:MAG: hypothetical protein NVS9B10_05360 [Nevskia sp.]
MQYVKSQKKTVESSSSVQSRGTQSRQKLPQESRLRLVDSQSLKAVAPRGIDSLSRILDITLALGLLVIFFPIIVMVTVLLACSPGPVFFSQARLGQGGRAFQVYKFRTMVQNAPEVLKKLLADNPHLRTEWESDFKLKQDPRVTPIGRFLRRTSLDELPQLWNILIGDMSLVGPRPVAPVEIAKYGRFAKHYYAQRPGLTGLWQVSGRNDASYERRVILDAFYSKNRSLWMDLSIILKTIRVVLMGSGAY